MAGGITAEDLKEPFPFTYSTRLDLKKVKEPSGLCYHAERKSMFVVDDGGLICEFKPDGTIVQRKKIGKLDLEGITSNPASGLLYVAVEETDTILEVDPETLDILREFQVPETFEGRTVMKLGGSGLEGITFAPNAAHPHGGTFFVANQSDDLVDSDDLSAIFEVEIALNLPEETNGSVKIIRSIRPGVVDIAGLHYESSEKLLYAISDTKDRMMAFNDDGDQVGAWKLPGKNQEGILITPDGLLCIGQDSGGILIYNRIKPPQD